MQLYAIGDLHLPGGQNKPMDVFGAHWAGHWERILKSWRAQVLPEDVVLLPGDLSWAMTMEEAAADIARICALPGRKVLLRGNHDYWWSSISRLRSLLPPGSYALQNDAIALDQVVVAGSRGWVCACETADPQDRKIYLRELGRLELSLKDACRKAEGRRIVAMTHFPPYGEGQKPSGFTELLHAYGVRDAVYGHLHGEGLRTALRGEWEGVRYHPVSCDGLGFSLYRLPGDG